MAIGDRQPAGRTRPTRAGRAVHAIVVPASVAATGWLLWRALTTALSGATPPWTLGRASGLTCYGLLVVSVTLGLLLSHPTARRLLRPGPVLWIRLHAAVAVFTLAFLALHVLVLATDPWAHVGWRGALLPMASRYRPTGVTLGVLATWSALVTGVTAALAGRWLGRAWWPVHKTAGAAFLLAWVHGVWSGSDSAALLGMYLTSGGAVLALALSRYRARTVADLSDEAAAVAPGRPPSGTAASKRTAAP